MAGYTVDSLLPLKVSVMPLLLVGRRGDHLVSRGDHRLSDDRPGHLAQPQSAGLLHVEERLHVPGLLGKLQDLASRLEQDVGEGRLGDL